MVVWSGGGGVGYRVYKVGALSDRVQWLAKLIGVIGLYGKGLTGV